MPGSSYLSNVDWTQYSMLAVILAGTMIMITFLWKLAKANGNGNAGVKQSKANGGDINDIKLTVEKTALTVNTLADAIKQHRKDSLAEHVRTRDTMATIFDKIEDTKAEVGGVGARVSRIEGELKGAGND